MKKAAVIAAYWQGAASSKGHSGAQCRCSRPVAGPDFKTLFTNWAGRRYDWVMFMLAAAALAVTSTAAPQAVAPDRQARATVRIIPGAKLRFAEIEKADPKLFRESRVRSANGLAETAKLIEFE